MRGFIYYMSLYRKIKSKVNKMMRNRGSKEIFHKDVCKDSIETSVSIYLIDDNYSFDLEDYMNDAEIYINFKEVGVNEFKLTIGGGFGRYMESEKYLPIYNQVNGDYKYMLRFFKEFIEELHRDTDSVYFLYDFLEYYKAQ